MMDIGLFKVDEKMTQCLRSELVHVLITADLVRKVLGIKDVCVSGNVLTLIVLILYVRVCMCEWEWARSHSSNFICTGMYV